MSTQQPQGSARISLATQTPRIYMAISAVDRAVSEAQVDPRLRELINVRVSQLNRCAFCLAKHTAGARKAGVSQEQLDTLSAWREAPGFDSRDRAALDLAEAITLIAGENLSDEVYDEVARLFTSDEIAALIGAVIAINGWNRVAIACGMS